jgi:hypothetical protein
VCGSPTSRAPPPTTPLPPSWPRSIELSPITTDTSPLAPPSGSALRPVHRPCNADDPSLEEAPILIALAGQAAAAGPLCPRLRERRREWLKAWRRGQQTRHRRLARRPVKDPPACRCFCLGHEDDL